MTMSYRRYPITAAVLFLILMPLTARADILHLKIGKELNVERAWQESDQVCFILQGLKASIPQSKVSRIECITRNSNDPRDSGNPENKFNADLKPSSPEPAVELPPNRTKKTAESVSTSQPESLTPGKTLFLRRDGLGDLKWGTRLVAVKGLKQRHIDSGLEDVTEYVRPADVLKLGDAALIAVVYAFWQDQFYTATIWTQGPANYNALRDAASKQFGQGTQIESAGERYLWSDSLTDAMLKYETDGHFGMLWLRSKKLDRKLKLTKIISPTSYLKWMKSR
jgi:hypothetical protein